MASIRSSKCRRSEQCDGAINKTLQQQQQQEEGRWRWQWAAGSSSAPDGSSLDRAEQQQLHGGGQLGDCAATTIVEAATAKQCTC